MTSFSDLGLAAPILKALDSEGYKAPTPIQAKAIPPVLEGRDLLGIAQTGTGKTAAFALPILHRLEANRRPAPRKGCRALILSPTRELASQIAESFRAYGRHLGITVAVVFGGVGHRPQIQSLARGVDVLVATPGRLLDLMEQRAADIAGTEIFVLDEADQMLDLGFVKPIRRIVSFMSHRRQNLFFSATMPTEISGLANELLNNPVKVSVAPVATTAERVRQRVIHIEAGKKRALLTELLADPEMTRTLVFTRTKRGADRVARHLENGGTKVAAIHGNKSQRQRELALEDFKHSRINVLVATDIAARGIDIDLVTHVVNYELPEVPEAYVHRIGRTARAGASGIAISLCDVEERDQLRAIERLTRQQIPHEDRRNDPSIVAERTPPQRDDGQRTGGNPRGDRRANGRPNGHQQAHRGDARRNGSGEARGNRSGEARANHNGERGDRQPEGRANAAGNGNRNGSGQRAHRADGTRGETNRGRNGNGSGNHNAPRDRNHRAGDSHHRASGNGDANGHRRPDRNDDRDSVSSLESVGFLARSAGPRRPRGGGNGRPMRPGFARRDAS